MSSTAESTRSNPIHEALREKAVEAAKRHKISWVELGQYLQKVYQEKLFKEWGFLTFEGYCMKELNIKRTTASKLVGSYQFLEKEEPRLLQPKVEQELAPKEFPDYEAVNVLRLAKANSQLKPQDYAALREAVLEEGREPKEIRSQMKKILEQREPQDPAETRRARRNSMLRRLIGLLNNTQEELGGAKMLPGGILSQIKTLCRELEAQIE